MASMSSSSFYDVLMQFIFLMGANIEMSRIRPSSTSLNGAKVTVARAWTHFYDPLRV